VLHESERRSTSTAFERFPGVLPQEIVEPSFRRCEIDSRYFLAIDVG
jgi:hypothetical protein